MSSSRRRFLKTAAAAGVAATLPSSPFEEILQAQSPGQPGSAPAVDGYVLVTSANGVEAAKATRQALIQGYDPLDAAIVGV
ncbi:MAG: twin-arginine translocation signal domain-containing protein, partial [Acidobacteriota bacterium]|nr:twin-arginine translocation signal domain-containing protein [Acidobacteriota bacterium]